MNEENGEALCAISRSSSTHRALALPLLFKQLYIQTYSPRYPERMEGISSLLDTYPEAGRWTAELEVWRGVWTDSYKAQAAAEAHKTLSKVLFQMTGLKTIRLDGLPLSIEAVHHLLSLPLRLLSVSEVAINGDKVTNSGQGLEGLCLTEVHLNGNDNPFGLTDFGVLDPDWIRLASIPSVSSLVLQGGATNMLQRRLSSHLSHIFTNLRSLHMDPPIPGILHPLISLLEACPNLTELVLHDVPPNPMFIMGPGGGAIPTLRYAYPPALHLVPHLSSYSGSLDIAKMLVPGRPVAELKVGVYGDLLDDDLENVSKSSTDIKRLQIVAIHWTEEYKSRLQTLFPDLKEIRIQVKPSVLMVSNLYRPYILSFVIACSRRLRCLPKHPPLSRPIRVLRISRSPAIVARPAAFSINRKSRWIL